MTLKRGQNIKYAPHVFTEHGAVMLANVLRNSAGLNRLRKYPFDLSFRGVPI
ncbi:MAG: hypothetical protein WB763_07255 [Terriglobia bacterium]